MSDIVKPLLYSVVLSKTLDKTDLHTLFVMGDNQAHRFELEILSGSKAVDLTGATVTGYFTNFKEDTTVTVPGKVEGGKAVVVLSKPCYTLHGQFVLTIQVKSGEVEDTVFLGEGFMRRTKGETIIYDDYIVYDVSTLLAQISAMKTATENANKATTDANEAADRANNAAGDAEDAVKAVEGWENAEATVEMLTPGSAPVVNVETAADGHRIIKMQLPMGETGLTPKITFQVETGAPGTDVQISQSGTAENPVIKLTIPRGDTGAVDGIDYYEGTPKALGTASPGTANGLARGDHVHPMPTAADVGALPAGGTAVNATQLNGKSADQYALKNELPNVPVQSVNGKTGAVSLSASDVGALSATAQAADSAKLGGKTWAERMLEIYPVGRIYISVNETSPASLFGGTWEQIKDCFLLGAGGSYELGSTGGEATHKLTEDELPALRGTINVHGGENGSNYWNPVGVFAGSQTVDKYIKVSGSTLTSASSITGLDFSAGNDMPHNNMPPWKAVNIWKRVA